MLRLSLLIVPLIIGSPLLTSCGDADPASAPVRKTEDGGKVDLSGVTLTTSNASIGKNDKVQHVLVFDYTLTNTSGFNIEFPCLYSNLDYLIEVNLSDKEGESVPLGRRPLDQLTMTQPRPERILVGTTTRTYKAPIGPNTLKPGDLLSVRIRLHAPSRYDELRTSLEAPTLTLPLPGKPAEKKP